MSGKAHESKMVTSVISNQYAFTWVLNDFSAWWAKVSGTQKSLKFPFGVDAKAVQWFILFHPKKSETHSGLYLQAVNTTGKFEVGYELAMEDSHRNTIVKRSRKMIMDWNKGLGWHAFINNDKLLEAINEDDQLYIICKMTAYEKNVNESLRENLPEPIPSSMSKDMDTLVDGTTFGDVTILIDGQRYLAYKGILSARSAVFAAMFEHPMQESTENCITINDVEPGVFKELLRYIYTDQLTCLETMAQKLYQVADKYDIQTLKSLCRCHILKKMSSETAADTLVLADMHGDKEMKSHALGFLSGSEAGKVTKSAGWKKMFRTHPYLVDETFEALTARKTVG
uniref:Speckle-type POZ protein-like B n=1 Tax=Culex pipiens TaxID=7175 RepID=A0A8D8H354_CULPI